MPVKELAERRGILISSRTAVFDPAALRPLDQPSRQQGGYTFPAGQ